MAWIIAVVLLLALIAFVDDAATTRNLYLWFRIALGSIFFWFVFGPAWSVLFFRRQAPK